MPEDAPRVADETAVRDRLSGVLASVEFPVHDQLEVAAAIDQPHSQRVDVGDRTFTAMELAVRLEPHQDFPYESQEELFDDVVTGLREEGLL